MSTSKPWLQLLASLALGLMSILLVQCLWAAPVVVDGDVPIERNIEIETVVSGLVHPWGLAWLPDGNLLVTERPGRLRLIRMSPEGAGHLDTEPLEGVVPVYAGGQGGLLDVSLNPDFETSRLITLSYSHGNRSANRTRVARAVYDGDRLRNWEVIFETNVTKPGTQHFGSRLCWLPDKTLLVSVGDGGNPPVRLAGKFIREHAQNPANQLGSIVRISPDGSIPENNPFVGEEGFSPDIFSFGHRNIQGLAHDPVRNSIWATEHGALGGDELNRPRKGANFGWPAVTYSREYFDGSRISPDVSREGMVDPVAVWLTAIAPSGLTVYSGDRVPRWRGDLFAGALIKQSLRHISLDPQGRITGQQELRIGARVREVSQGPDGLLYVLTDEQDGRLVRIKPKQGSDLAP